MIAYDFKTRLPKEMLRNKDRMARGGEQINRAFTSPNP